MRQVYQNVDSSELGCKLLENVRWCSKRRMPFIGVHQFYK